LLKTKKAVASVLCLTFALSVAWMTIPVFADAEQLPLGLLRVRSDCVWDNDHNSTVEQEDWALAGQGVNVAVIDTGVWFEGVPPYEDFPRDLDENIKKLVAFSQVNDDECDPCNPVSYGTYHGTMCAGIIGALDNDFGVIGNAPKVNLFIVQMMQRTKLECAYGINWSVANGADIISISYAWQEDNEMLRGACDYAASRGVLVVAAAGNNESAPIAYPARYENVVAVGAINESDQRWSDHTYPHDPDTGSSSGPELDFVAPGANINSTADGLNCYASDNGTSMACPHVAAAAALVKGSVPEAAYGNVWNATTILQKLNDTALDLPAEGWDPGWDPYTGLGLVNAWRANQRPQGNINNDNCTNAKDAVKLGWAYGSTPNTTKWNRNADINIDNYINAKDGVIIGVHFGQGSGGIPPGRSLAIYGSKLKVQPSSLTFYADTTSVGDNFTVSLVADNVTGLYGWELGLHWTSGLVDCVNETVNYAVWSDYLGPWVTPAIDNENGTYHQSLTARDPASSFNGTTWLANLTFQIMQAPPEGGSLSTALTITTESGLDYCLLNSSAAEIPHDFVQGSFKYVSARYMRSDTHTINGLQAYKLNTSQTASYLETNVTETESNTVYWGIRVWKRNSAGTETEVTSGTPVAQVSRSTSGYGIQSATWNCPNTTLASTDSIVVRVYCMNSGNWILQATFTTKRLNAQTADPATWHVYYWTKRNYISGGLGKTIGYFRWGTPTYNSRTEDFTTT